MNERDLRLLLSENTVKNIEVHDAVMFAGYMIIVKGRPLETQNGTTRDLKTLDAVENLLFRNGVAEFNVKPFQNEKMQSPKE